jgi:SET and MYND domain-containing protein 5
MAPLETAEENVRRLAFDESIVLPLPQLDATADFQHNFTSCIECGTQFCSKACLEMAEKIYHRVICEDIKPGARLDQLNEVWKKIHYPPETATIMLIVRIFAMLKANSVPNLMQKLDEFSSRSVNEDISLCHKMLGEKFSEQLNEIHQALVEVFRGDAEILGKYLSHDGFVSLLAIIGTNSQGIGTSSFANYVKNIGEYEMSDEQRDEIDNMIDSIYTRFNDTVGSFLNNEGSGLYQLQSKINHSCVPNSEIIFNGNHTLQIKALRDIKAGEEICISYLDECQLERSRHSRRKYLEENYIFQCSCEKCECQINDADVTSEDEEMDTDDDDD